MTTIGIYDSGIGGFTTLKALCKHFEGCDFYYLADNLHHPFGNKNKGEIDEIVRTAIKKLKSNCDIPILACNTASTSIDDNSVIKLLPPIQKVSSKDFDKTLMLATPRTIKNVACKNLKCADTTFLAPMIETQAHIRARYGDLDMSPLLQYLAEMLFTFKGVSKVILGCSHYPYCKQQIHKILGEVEFFDGNDDICLQIDHLLKEGKTKSPNVRFEFSGYNDVRAYSSILQLTLASQL